MKLLLITIYILLVTVITGCSLQSMISGSKKIKKSIERPIKPMVIQLEEVVINEDELFQKEFKDLFVNINLYNQLSNQGVKMNIQGDFTTGLDKEIKRVLKGKVVKIKTIKKGVKLTTNKQF